MRAISAVALAGCAVASAALAAGSPRQDYESQVVSLVITTQDYDQMWPWEKLAPQTHTGQAIVVDGPLLATTADLVEGATLVLVEKHGRPLREPARIVHIDRNANLVLLTVETPGFYDDLKPVALAPAMPTGGEVSTVRWDSGHLEVSSSRVKEIEVEESRLGALAHAFLLVRTDLSSGGWGEALFSDGRFIGLTYSQQDQIATVVPVDLLRGYLAAVRQSGAYREFANLQLFWQVNRSSALTRWLGLEGEPRGALITAIPWGSSACGALLPRDILLSLDGHSIDANGMYEDSRYGRLEFTQIVADGHRAGDTVPAEVLRDGKVIPVRITLRHARGEEYLVPIRTSGAPPPFLVAGGFVFRPLDGDYLRAWGNDWQKKAPPLLMIWYDEFRSRETATKRGVVVLSHVLPSSYNVGYADLQQLPVARINGRPIESIADADEAFRHPEGEFHRIEFVPNPERNEVVLDAATLGPATDAILERYRIPQRVRLPADPLPDLGPDCPGHP